MKFPRWCVALIDLVSLVEFNEGCNAGEGKEFKYELAELMASGDAFIKKKQTRVKELIRTRLDCLEAWCHENEPKEGRRKIRMQRKAPLERARKCIETLRAMGF